MKRLLFLLLAGCSTSDGQVLQSLTDGGQTAAPDAELDAGMDCELEGPCPLPSAGNFTLCGRVLDLQTSKPLPNTSVLGANLSVKIFELSELDDEDDAPLATATPDACGWYVAANLQGPASGALVVTTQSNNASDLVLRVGSVAQTTPGQVGRAHAWALTRQAESELTIAAGLSSGDFASGALLAIYSDLNQPAVFPLQGTPVDGVTITRNGLPQGDQYYFSDTESLVRREIVVEQRTTGLNGSAFMQGFAISTEASGDKVGCSFVEVASMSAIRILQVQEIRGSCQ